MNIVNKSIEEKVTKEYEQESSLNNQNNQSSQRKRFSKMSDENEPQIEGEEEDGVVYAYVAPTDFDKAKYLTNQLR